MNIDGVFTSLPLVIFAYMYQVNVPAVYTELEIPNMKNIKAVLIFGTLLAVIVYIFTGIIDTRIDGETRPRVLKDFEI